MSSDDRRSSAVLETVVDKRDVLAAIEGQASPTLDSIGEATGLSKSTVNRAVSELEGHGLVDADRSGQPHSYALTFYGAQLLDWAEDGEEHREYRRLYSSLPADADLPRWVVAGGNVAVPSDGDPLPQVFDQITATIERADRLRVVVPAMTRDRSYEQIATAVAKGLTLESIAPQSFLSALGERFGAEFSGMLERDSVTVHTLGEVSVPYGFAIGERIADGKVVDSEMSVVCYDEQGHAVDGTLVNDDPAAVAWAEARFERYRARASRAERLERASEPS